MYSASWVWGFGGLGFGGLGVEGLEVWGLKVCILFELGTKDVAGMAMDRSRVTNVGT